MKKTTLLTSLFLFILCLSSNAKKEPGHIWPDGTQIDSWFFDTTPVDISKLGKQYVLTDYRIFADGRIHTTEIQALIDKAAADGI